MPKPDRKQQVLDALADGLTLTADELAEAHGVSPRTIYRDMAWLKNQGVPITGEPGLGYTLDMKRPVVTLDLTIEQVQQLRVGLRRARGEAPFTLGAPPTFIAVLLERISASTPDPLVDLLER